MGKTKQITVSPKCLAGRSFALLGFASLDDTYFIDGSWVAVSDWRSWRHQQTVGAYRHAGLEDTGLVVGEQVAFQTNDGQGRANGVVTAITMVRSHDLTSAERAALDDHADEIEHFHNDAAWYVTFDILR